jgi:hypothetical protein
MMHSLDFNPRQILAERRKALQSQALATAENVIANESLVTEGCSDFSSFSKGTGRVHRSVEEVEKELAHFRYLYAQCIDFERKPFPRKLDRDCIAAGYEALGCLKSKIADLESEEAAYSKPNAFLEN